MTTTRTMSMNPADHVRSRRWRHALALALGVSIAGVSVSAIAAPMLNPGPLAPIARVLPYKIDQSARIAMVTSLLKQGYVITKPVEITSQK